MTCTRHGFKRLNHIHDLRLYQSYELLHMLQHVIIVLKILEFTTSSFAQQKKINRNFLIEAIELL